MKMEHTGLEPGNHNAPLKQLASYIPPHLPSVGNLGIALYNDISNMVFPSDSVSSISLMVPP